MKQPTAKYDVAVVGMGYAGLASALFAAARGLSVAVCGATGALDFSSGLIDLLAVHPIGQGRVWQNPWDGISALIRDRPDHPYALLRAEEIRAALAGFGSFMEEQGLPYRGQDGLNSPVLTPAGTVKQSFLLPETVWPGSLACRQKAPTLLVGFSGLKGYSPRQITEMRRQDWPGLRHALVEFPGKSGELLPEHIALALGDPEVIKRLARSLEGPARGMDYLGFPAVLGLKSPGPVVSALEELTGKRVFEIPTMPPSLAGPRLRFAFGRGLARLGVALFQRRTAARAEPIGSRGWRLHLEGPADPQTLEARGVILAGGRFLSHGLVAERKRIVEPLFLLPVSQPEKREDWRRGRFLDPNGHLSSRAGLLTDGELRPLDENGCPTAGLRAAGSILANHDWAREKSGAGLAIATAYKAAASLASALKAGEA